MPKIQVPNFTGGVNNAIEPRLLPVDTAQQLLDGKVESGIIEPNVQKKEVSDPDIPELTNQSDGERSIVRFGDDYYFSNNSTGVLGSTLGFIGITPPNDALVASPGIKGSRFKGVFRYIVKFITDEGHRSGTNLPGEEGNYEVSIDTEIPDENLTTFPAFNADDYFFENESLGEWVIEVGTLVTHKGKSWKLKTRIYIRKPYEGFVFWEDQEPGEASNLWEDVSSVTQTVSGHDTIILTKFPTPSESAVTKIEIYRTLVGGDIFYLNTTIDKEAASYTDAVPDGQLALREQLPLLQGFPPIYQGTTRVGGKYLTEVNERFWLAVDNRLYHSLQSDPHSWNPLHSVEFDSTITGLARSGSSILVFLGAGNPWVVSGNVESATISKVQLPSTQGCPNWKTIAYAGNAPLWQSPEGICGRFQRPLGQDPEIRVITKDKYNFPRIGDFALAKDDQYNLFFDDKTVTLDIGRNNITTRSLTGDYGFYNTLDGILYLVENGLFYDANAGDEVTFTYKSPKLFGTDIHALKQFRVLNVQSEGDITYSILVDDKETIPLTVFEHTSINKRIPLTNMDGYWVELIIKSSKRLYNYSIDYEVDREDNI